MDRTQTATTSLDISNWFVFTTETKWVYCAVRAESSNIIRVNDRDQSSSGLHPTCLSPWPWVKQPERVCHSFSYRNVAPLHAKVVWGNGGMDPLTLSLGARQGSQLHVPVTVAPRKEFLLPTENEAWCVSAAGLHTFKERKFYCPCPESNR
jgi:hypothetical protein